MLTIGFVFYNEEKRFKRIAANVELLTENGVNCILVDNASTDQTLLCIKNLSARYGAHVIARRENNMGAARADVVIYAGGEWVGFIDGDCVIDQTWVQNALRLMECVGPKVSAFGGPLLPAGGQAAFYKNLFKSFLGNINSTQVKNSVRGEFVSHLPTANIIYRRKDLMEVGNFSSHKNRVGEDLDMSYRLSAAGKTLRFEPALKVSHELPETFPAWIKKVFLYGTARGEVGFEQRKLLTYPFLLPLLFFSFILLNILFLNEFRAVPPLIYLFLVFTHALYYGARSPLKLFGYFVAMHCTYSVGLVWGVGQVFKKRFAHARYAAHEVVQS